MKPLLKFTACVLFTGTLIYVSCKKEYSCCPDWVPETPISIQTLNDFNNTNPFVNADALIKSKKISAAVIRAAFI